MANANMEAMANGITIPEAKALIVLYEVANIIAKSNDVSSTRRGRVLVRLATEYDFLVRAKYMLRLALLYSVAAVSFREDVAFEPLTDPAGDKDMKVLFKFLLQESSGLLAGFRDSYGISDAVFKKRINATRQQIGGEQ